MKVLVTDGEYGHTLDIIRSLEKNNFKTDEKFDLILTSGVLYLYDDELVDDFFNKIKTILNNEGSLIIRDFINLNEYLKKKSSFIKDGFCYYRTPRYWNSISKKHGFSEPYIIVSSPRLKVIKYFLLINKKIFSNLPVSNPFNRMIKDNLLIKFLNRFGNHKLKKNCINTVFICLKKT